MNSSAKLGWTGIARSCRLRSPELKQKRKMSAIVVTHDIHGAKEYSDRMVLLHNGSIRAEGSFDDLEQSKDEFVAQFFGNGSR